MKNQNIKKNNLPDDAYYGFTNYSRMNYGNINRGNNFIDEITFGIYVRSGGCVSEADIRWEYLSGKPVYKISIFDDGLEAAFSENFLKVISKLKTRGYVLPEYVSKLLIKEGFEDLSSNKLE